jgi:acetylornithine deacetylase
VSSPVLELLARLVAIESVNPSYPGGSGEGAIARFVADWAAAAGLETRVSDVFPGRPNVWIRLPGRDPERRVLLEAHLDTVSVEGMTIPPFEPRIEGGRLFGRGSCDTKGGLAAMMEALRSLRAEGTVPPCDVWLAAVADEEYGFRGVVRFLEEWEGPLPEAALVAEPTTLRLVTVNKGVVRWRVRTRGRAAHSSKPHLGSNAITAMARVVLALEADAARLGARSHPRVGPATLNVGTIRGGEQVNLVPDTCVIEIDRRLLPGETAAAALAECQAVLDQLRAVHPEVDAEMEAPWLEDAAMETPEDAAVVRVARTVAGSLGLSAEPVGVPFGCDATKLHRAGIPSLVFGPGNIDRAHAADEFVETEEVEKALEFYRRFLVEFA